MSEKIQDRKIRYEIGKDDGELPYTVHYVREGSVEDRLLIARFCRGDFAWFFCAGQVAGAIGEGWSAHYVWLAEGEESPGEEEEGGAAGRRVRGRRTAA